MGTRMFAALLPPASMIDELDALLEPRREAGADLWRWTRPQGWHVTTAFMESVPDRALDGLVEGLAEVTRSHAPFEVRLAGARCFPSVDRAKLLALDVAAGAEPLGQLSRACRAAASRAGAPPDGATFVGHLTLGRARRTTDATRWVHVVDSFPGWSWRADELVLVASHLADRGNRYEVVERFRLGGSSEVRQDIPRDPAGLTD